MRKALVLLAVGMALAFAGTASAGCWATVGVTPLPDVGVGETWTASIQVLQHGRTPLATATPVVVIRNAETGVERTVAATLLDGAGGLYQAKVVFPSAGNWSVAVNDGFPESQCAQTHTFGSVAIGGGGSAQPPVAPEPRPAVSAVTPPSPESGGSSLVLPLGLGLGLGFAALGVAGALALRARHGRAARAA
jgi:hypothetical protein